MQSTDEILVKQAILGNKRAFGKLVERYQNAVYGLAYHFTRNVNDAQDIAQEAFLQAYLKLGQLKEAAKFAHWLRRITMNVCKMWLRRAKPETLSLVSLEELKSSRNLSDEWRSLASEPSWEISESSSVEAAYEAREIQGAVQSAIDALSEKNRLAVTLYYIDGLTQKEVSNFLEVSLGTIKSRLHEARKQLQKELIQRGFGDKPSMVMVKESLQAEKLPDDFRSKIEKMLKSADAIVRRKAVHQLQEYHREHREDQAVEDLIIEATKDESGEVRKRAVQALGWLRCEKSIPRLAERLKDADLQVQKCAEWSLNHIGTEQVVNEVLKLLNFPNEVTRRHAVDILKGICSEKEVPRLLQALREDEDVGVKERIIYVLSDIRDDVAAQELAQLLWDDEERLRKAAMDALRQMKPANVAPILMKALDAENLQVQRWAIKLLGELNYKDAESKLIQKLEYPDPEVAFRATEALGRMKSEKALEPLISLLQNRERITFIKNAGFPILYVTIGALGQIGNAKVVPQLIGYLQEFDLDNWLNQKVSPIPIRAILKAFAQIGDPQAIPHIAKLVDCGYFIGEVAIEALGHLGPNSIPYLGQVLAKSESHNKRWRAAKALGEIGGPDALESLKAALKDAEPSVRYHTVIALGQLGHQAAIPYLKEATQDEKHGVRQEALKALKRLGLPESKLPEISAKPVDKKQKKQRSKSERILSERVKAEKGKLPAKDSLRRAILEKFVAENFEVGKVYQEKEVNEIIHRAYDDHCSVRRYLVDYRLMSRDQGRYWVIPTIPTLGKGK